MNAKVHVLYSANSKELEGIISKLREPLLKQLVRLLTNMFNGADDVLFSLAEKEGNNLSQSSYFDAMRVLRLKRRDIEARFSGEIETNSKMPLSGANSSGSGASAASDSGTLELVADEEMEKAVAITGMAKKAEDGFQESIAHLETRLEWLGFKYNVAVSKEMFSPKMVATAFSNALDPVDLSIESKLIVYKLFEKEVMLNLGMVYDSLNAALIEAGVLPQVTLSHGYKRSGDRRQRSSGRTSGGSLLDELGEDTEAGQILKKLSDGGSSRARADGDYGAGDLAQVMSQVQMSLPEDLPELSPAEIKKALLYHIQQADGGKRRVSNYDEELIDVVSAMFEFMFNDSQLSDSVKALFSRLQIPYIKVALLDGDMLRDKGHPTRLLLNKLSETAVGIQSKEDDLFAKLQELIEVVVTNFSDNIQIFDFALQELERLSGQEQAQAQSLEEQIQHEAKRDAQRLLARKMVLYELKKQLGGRSLPSDLHALILKAWAPLMMLRYIRFGRKSPQWRESVSILGDVIASAFPLNTQSDLQAFREARTDLPGVLRYALLDAMPEDRETIESSVAVFERYFRDRTDELAGFEAASESVEGFSETAFDDVAAAANAVEPLVIQDLSGDETETPASGEQDAETPQAQSPATGQVPPEAPTMAETSSGGGHVPIEDDEEPERALIESNAEQLNQLPEGVRPGAWFEIYTGSDTVKRRLKLSTMIEETAQLVFVNRSGQRVLDKTAGEFAKELEQGTSKLINDNNLFDRALLSVIQNMQRGRDGASA